MAAALTAAIDAVAAGCVACSETNNLGSIRRELILLASLLRLTVHVQTAHLFGFDQNIWVNDRAALRRRLPQHAAITAFHVAIDHVEHFARREQTRLEGFGKGLLVVHEDTSGLNVRPTPL